MIDDLMLPASNSMDSERFPQDATTLWVTPDRGHHFLIPDEADLPAGDLVLRTATGREQSVDEAAVLPYEVSEAEAKAWAEEQLRDTLGEVRGNVLGFVNRLKARTAEMREENRRTWEEGVTNAPPELREAAGEARTRLRDLGRALQRIARENLDRAEAERRSRAEPGEPTEPGDAREPTDPPEAGDAPGAKPPPEDDPRRPR